MAGVPYSKADPQIFTQSEATAAQATFTFHLTNNADGTDATGKTLATSDISISKAGGAFADATGTATELTGGWYKFAFSATDLNTLGALAVEINEAGCDPVKVIHQVVAYDPYVALAVAAVEDASGIKSTQVFTQSEATAAQATWVFHLANTADGSDATGKTLATTDIMLSKAGGAFAQATGTCTELTDGWYKMVFSTTDLNTLGSLGLEVNESGCRPVRAVHQVVAYDPYVALALQNTLTSVSDDLARLEAKALKNRYQGMGLLNAAESTAGQGLEDAWDAVITCTGTWDSSTVTAEVCADPLAVVPVWIAYGTPLTADGTIAIASSRAARAVRCSMTNPGGSSSVTCTIAIRAFRG